MLTIPGDARRKRFIDTVTVIAVFLILILWGWNLFASNVERETVTAEHVDRAIVHLLTKGLPSHKIDPHPNHRLMKQPELRKELSLAINEHADTYKVPEMFLVAVAFREGSFKNDAEGLLKERSTFQIGKGLAKKCDLSTYDGAAKCAARHLREEVSRCGSLRGSFMWYATGRTCKPDHKHLKWMDRDRWGIASKLQRIVLDG